MEQILRNEQYINRLADFIHHEYGLSSTFMSAAKRGWYGETWRLNTTEASYFVKAVSLASHKPLYKRSFSVMDYLSKQGISYTSKVVKTKQNRLFSNFDGAVVGVFEWIDGENIQNKSTKLPEYDMLSRIYAISRPGLNIPYEHFSDAKARQFFKQWDQIKALPQDNTTIRILNIFEQNSARFDKRACRLAEFSKLCKTDTSSFFITHGDAGGNVIVDGDHFSLVDWDDSVYAPPERDAWFCVHWDWAINGFNEALRRNGVDYTLRTERLLFYCYYSFFMYLTLYMAIFLEVGDRGGLVDELSGYMNCWIEDNIKCADSKNLFVP